MNVSTAQLGPAGRDRLEALRPNGASGPLWATVQGHPGIWIRWTETHEEWVESEQAVTTGNRMVGIHVVGRIVRCGRYGEWCIGNWRPRCGECRGTGQVVVTVGDDKHCPAFVNTLVSTMDAGLLYMAQASVACHDCLAHPGWAVG